MHPFTWVAGVQQLYVTCRPYPDLWASCVIGPLEKDACVSPTPSPRSWTGDSALQTSYWVILTHAPHNILLPRGCKLPGTCKPVWKLKTKGPSGNHGDTGKCLSSGQCLSSGPHVVKSIFKTRPPKSECLGEISLKLTTNSNNLNTLLRPFTRGRPLSSGLPVCYKLLPRISMGGLS